MAAEQRYAILGAVYAQQFASWEAKKSSLPDSVTYFHQIAEREGGGEADIFKKVGALKGIGITQKLRLYCAYMRDISWLLPMREQVEVLILEKLEMSLVDIRQWRCLRILRIEEAAASSLRLNVADCEALEELHISQKTTGQALRLDLRLRDCVALRVCLLHGLALRHISIVGCVELHDVDLSRLALERLDLDDLPDVRRLSIAQNPITLLHVSRPHGLQLLKCQETRLKELPAACLQKLEELVFWGTAIAVLDGSALPSLRSVEFAIDEQRIQHSRVSEWRVHTQGISVSVRGEEWIETLDISACPNIEFIDFRGCLRLTKLHYRALGEASEKVYNIRGVHDTRISERDKKYLLLPFMQNTYTRQLYARDLQHKLHEAAHENECICLNFITAVHRGDIEKPSTAVFPVRLSKRQIAKFNHTFNVPQMRANLANCKEAYIATWVEDSSGSEHSLADILSAQETHPSIDDLKPVTAFLTEVERLHIYNQTQLRTLAGIAYCRNLAFLDVAMCPITEIGEIVACSELTFISFDSCRLLRDIRPLSRLAWLEELHLSSCAIDSLEPLKNLPYLRRIICGSCPELSEAAIKRFRQQRPDCQVIDYL